MRKSSFIHLLALFIVVLSLSGCANEKFVEIPIEGTESKFSMPSGFQDGPLGQGHWYKGKLGEAFFKVNITPRTKQEQDKSGGISDEAKISELAKQTMDRITKDLGKHGYAGQKRYDGIVANQNGYTVQYTVAVEDRTVYNRFYITPQLVFYVEASCNDPQNEDVAKFFDLLQP